MRIQHVSFLLALAQVATAQAPGTTISGVVRDTISRTPLAGAQVQVVAANPASHFGSTVVTDSIGRYSVDSVPDGKYMLGFYHPILDSLGVEAPLREVSVVAGKALHADLVTPSAAQLRAAICKGKAVADAGGLLIGTVRDARERAPMADVTVSGEWLELSFRAGGVDRKVPHLAAKTGDNGWFAMCGVPSNGTMQVVASHGADSTDVIDVPIPAEGFVRRELYLGASRSAMITDTAKRSDGTTSPPHLMRTGDGRLSGTVVSAAEGKPLPGAQVGMTSGPRTRANERGEWTLAEVPSGTRMLEVHAVGYYPDRRIVDITSAAAPLRLALPTMKAVLDTVRVTAQGSAINGGMIGFEERRKSTMGRFIDATEIAKRNAIVASDLFRNLPGVQLVRSTFGDSIKVRSASAGLGADEFCVPAVFVDGHFMEGLSATDLDDFARPEEIAGIEVYTGATAPPQFMAHMSGCGTIVIWRKPPKH